MGAKSPPHFCKYFTLKNCAAIFSHTNTHLGIITCMMVTTVQLYFLYGMATGAGAMLLIIVLAIVAARL